LCSKAASSTASTTSGCTIFASSAEAFSFAAQALEDPLQKAIDLVNGGPSEDADPGKSNEDVIKEMHIAFDVVNEKVDNQIQMSKSTQMLLRNLDRFVRSEADFQLPLIRQINSAYQFSFAMFEKAHEAFAAGRTRDGNNHLDDLRTSTSSAFAKLNGGDKSLLWPSAFQQILRRALTSAVENKKYTYCEAAQLAMVHCNAT